MESVYCVQALLLFLLVCSSGISGDVSPDQSSDDTSLDVDSSTYNKRQYMWFGPRLGRNKRNPSYDDILLKDEKMDDSIMDLIKESPWALVPLRGSDRNILSFTPRLGRTNDDDQTMEASRSPPFAPRLGRRRHIQFSPRLGRTYNSLGSH
ncbi:PBAN-type neuropeptides-like [Lycorma delicatula]|uniref:PBAN-type neuropeptides-like n=1 Tax=Lycorma delicatula TaxID=130591 RepID=UPI003F515971